MSEPCHRLLTRGGWAEDILVGDCESPVIAPRNTYSNVAYALAGAAVIGLRPGAPGVLMGAFLIALAVGSALYHARKTIAANRYDRAGMLMVGGGLMAAAIMPPTPLAQVGAMLGIAGLLVLTCLNLAPRMDISYPMGFVLLFAAVPGLGSGAWGMTLVALALFAAAYAAWHLDRAFKAGLWGHAIWHVLTAASIAVMYLALTGPR